MPKRTNDFQELIASIYRQIVSEGGVVTESGSVFDEEAKTLREVDILVEYRFAHHNFILAIECRDRSRKDSVQWIDELIGKLGSLKVDKLVAVSKKGFAKAAARKALANGIETLTLEEAGEKDWDKYHKRLGLLVMSDDNYQLIDVQYDDGKQYLSLTELGLDNVVIKDDIRLGTAKEVFEYFFINILLPKIKERVAREYQQIYKTKEDLTKVLSQEICFDFDGFKVCLPNGNYTDISKIKMIIHSTRSVWEVEQTHSKFNQMMVSSGMHIDIDKTEIKFNIIQDPETKKIHWEWRRKPPSGT
jgi:hypothetical protein